jgi:hypothetical protein
MFCQGKREMSIFQLVSSSAAVVLLALVSSCVGVSPLRLGSGTVVELKTVGAMCVLAVQVPASRASEQCRIRIRTQPVDTGSFFANDVVPEFAYYWRLGSAVFDETHNLGKLALSDDRDAAAKCPQGGTYYLGVKLIECGEDQLCKAIVSAVVDHLAAVTVDVDGDMLSARFSVTSTRGVDFYVPMDSLNGRTTISMDIETVGTSFVGLYNIKWRPSNLVMFLNTVPTPSDFSRKFTIGPLQDGVYVVRIGVTSVGESKFAVKIRYGSDANGVDYPVANCAAVPVACASLSANGCNSCVTEGCKWCDFTAQCAEANTQAICAQASWVDRCPGGNVPPGAPTAAPGQPCPAFNENCNLCINTGRCSYCKNIGCVTSTAMCADNAAPLMASQCSSAGPIVTDQTKATGEGQRQSVMMPMMMIIGFVPMIMM